MLSDLNTHPAAKSMGLYRRVEYAQTTGTNSSTAGEDNMSCKPATYNSTVVSYINNQGGKYQYHCADRLNSYRALLMCQNNGTALWACHIPRRLTVLADGLSCPAQMSGTDWSLHISVFHAGMRNLLFAMRSNHKLPLFVSPLPDPSAMTVDALSISWKAGICLLSASSVAIYL